MNSSQRKSRVLAVVAAARSLTSQLGSPKGHALIGELVAATGLSSEGVLLALSKHLEISPSEIEIDSLVAASTTAPRVQVVLSANVFVGALRALALAVATSERVLLRCSSRERIFAPALISEIADRLVRDSISIAGGLDISSGDELHVYGSDQTAAQICAQIPPETLVRAHATGMGVALLNRGDNVLQAAKDIVADVIVFDQRGCLSPRIAFVDGPLSQAIDFAREISNQLAAAARSVPLGLVDPHQRAEIELWKATVGSVGELYGDHASGWVCAADELRALAIPPTGRNLLVAPVSEAALVSRLLAPIASHIACVAGVRDRDPGDIGGAIRLACAAARFCAAGQMQHPPLDGPVDLRHRAPETAAGVLRRLRASQA